MLVILRLLLVRSAFCGRWSSCVAAAGGNAHLRTLNPLVAQALGGARGRASISPCNPIAARLHRVA